MTLEQLNCVLTLSKEKNITEKAACLQLKLPYKNLYYHKKKYNKETSSRGKNPNCRKKRKYNINDDAFNELSPESCYWAGFFAADGNIAKNNIGMTLSLSIKDKDHLEKFKNFLKTEYPIKERLAQEVFMQCIIQFRSEKIVNDLYYFYNITPRKSLTLEPPNIKDPYLQDCFIIGYLDGDGSIGLYKSKRQKSLHISALGTENILNWINERFQQISGKNFNKNIYMRKNNTLTYSIVYSDKKARKLFLHFEKIKVPKLERKWSHEFKEHCLNYSKYKDMEKKLLIKKLYDEGMNLKNLALKFGVTYQAIYYHLQTLNNNESNIEDNG
jgi:hypothetical protein